MKGIVWGLTTANAIVKMEEIEKNYLVYNIANLLTKRKSKTIYELVYDNGDHWIACGAKESERGHKCNVSYIDVNIDLEFINTIIKPCTSAGPYQAFHYYMS